MSDLDLVILCGGKGSRLKNITKNIPKPLLKINSLSFIEIIIKYYQKLNLNKIYLLAGYKGQLIKKKFQKKKFNFVECNVIIENKALGTAGSLSNLKRKIKNNFLLVNGDSYIEYDLEKFINFEKKNYLGKILLTNNKNYKQNKKLSSLFIKKNKVIFKNSSKLMNAGIYIFKKKFLNFIIKKYYSLENNVLPNLINNKKILGEISHKKFIDIGLKHNLNYARNFFFKKKNSAVFLDRDGVINKDLGHVHTYRNFQWTKGIFKTLKFFNQKYDYVFIITNQAGIAKGIYSEMVLEKLHNKIKNVLTSKKIFIDDIFYCPHHPTLGYGKYKKKCKCRKPGNLLIEKAIKNWNIDRKKTIMIGDKISDKNCAKKSKIKFFYYDKNLLSKIKKNC